MNNTKTSLLRFYTSSTDKMGTKLFYEYIVEQAREYGLSGATVFRGIMGYGLSSTINSSKFWELTEKLPVIVEIVDENEKLLDFYNQIKDKLNAFSKGCLIAINPVSVLLNKKGSK